MKKTLLLLSLAMLLHAGDTALLGTDSDKNGIRDDIDQWITSAYKHPIERALLTQAAKLYQKQLKLAKRMKNDKAFAITFKMGDANAYSACELYWAYDAKEAGEPFVLYENDSSAYFTKALEEKIFNTPRRKTASEVLYEAISGRSCPLVEPDKSRCDFNANKLLKGAK